MLAAFASPQVYNTSYIPSTTYAASVLVGS
jgi:hypothetical protein